MLTDHYVPVAFDQWYLRAQDDVEGRFYQKIANQGPRNDMNKTTQGFYIADAAGKLLVFNNNRGPQRIRNLMRSELENWKPPAAAPLPFETQVKLRVPATPPRGTIVVQVNTQVLDGYSEPDSSYEEIMQTATGRDNLWIFEPEVQSLKRGAFPESLAKKLVQFHAVDNTRGEPPMWSDSHIESLTFEMSKDGEIQGSVVLENAAAKRQCNLKILGHVRFLEERLVRFDLVMLGQYLGQGKYTPGAPEGSFPLGVACRIADDRDPAWQVRPQALKAFGAGYLQMGN